MKHRKPTVQEYERAKLIRFHTAESYNQILDAMNNCPDNVIDWLRVNNWSISCFSGLEKRKRPTAMGLCYKDDNHISILTRRATKAEGSTVIHEATHAAQKDLEKIGLWEDLVKQTLKIGKEVYETARHIRENPSDFEELEATNAKAVCLRVVALVTAKSDIVARSMRSKHFNEVLSIYPHIESRLHISNLDDLARLLGMCLIAHISDLYEGDRKITDWNNREEAVCELVSFDRKLSQQIFGLLLKHP